MSLFTRQGRGRTLLLLASVLVVGAVCMFGCGGSVSGGGGGSVTLVDPGECDFGTVTDSRDDKTYKTVKIGGKTWMAQNLDYQTGNSWCYGGDDSNCEKYGRLYDWNTAKTVCPKDWHLPSRNEWTELVAMVGSETSGRKLKSTNGWNENGNGTDDYGFSALPGGLQGAVSAFGGAAVRGSGGVFDRAGRYGYWWTATESGSVYAYNRDMNYDRDPADEGNSNKNWGFSVRCVQN